MLRWILAGLCALVLAGTAGIEFGRSLLGPVSEREEIRLFRVDSGASLSAVAQRLEAEGLVRSARATTLLARTRELDQKLQVGEYELSPHLAAEEVLEIITSGRVKTWTVTFPEGSRAFDIAGRLESAGLVDTAEFLALVSDKEFAAALGVQASGLEGYLYPDTYHLPRGLSPREIARIMVRQFDRVWNAEISEHAKGSKLSREEIVILASIVEKETGDAAERPLIASVFLNRLGRGMRLETDPTVIYGIPDFDGNLRRKHLKDASNPYNTYQIQGLPPGPIANPGAAALRAVVQPETSEYLYFVSRNDGTHHFSTNYRSHVNAVNRYQKRRRR